MPHSGFAVHPLAVGCNQLSGQTGAPLLDPGVCKQQVFLLYWFGVVAYSLKALLSRYHYPRERQPFRAVVSTPHGKPSGKQGWTTGDNRR